MDIIKQFLVKRSHSNLLRSIPRMPGLGSRLYSSY